MAVFICMAGWWLASTMLIQSCSLWDWCTGVFLQFKHCNSEGKGFPYTSVATLKGKVSRKSRATESYTAQETSHKRFFGETQESSYLCSVRSSRVLELEAGLYRVSWGWSFPEWKCSGWGLVGFQILSLGASPGIGGIFELRVWLVSSDRGCSASAVCSQEVVKQELVCVKWALLCVFCVSLRFGK